MKVLHIFNSINFSGAEIMYEAAAPIFQSEGFKLYALNTGKEEGNYINNFKDAGYIVYHLPHYRQRSASYIFKVIIHFLKVYKLLKKEKIDVIHIHKHHLFYMYALVGRLSGIHNIIRTVHSVFTPRFYRWPGYFLSRIFAKYILKVKITSISQSVYLNELNHFYNKTYLINNWYNSFKFFKRMENEKDNTRKKFNLNISDYIIISVGSCFELKNHKDIVRAHSELLNSINIFYVHIGSGILEEEEKKLSVELGCSEYIKFVGNKSNIRDYLIASDAFIMTSDYEGLGLSAVEAMACGIPVILYDSPGLRDLIPKDSNNGMLIKKNYKEIVVSIFELINNPSLTIQMTNNAFDFAKQYYSMEINCKKMISLYNNKLH